MNPALEPRSHRDRREVQRKISLLHAPHIEPLTAYVEELRRERGGGESVPWFDPTEAGVSARVLLLLEAPGPRAVGAGGPRPAAAGSGFISPDNDDSSAETMWRLLGKAGIVRARDVVTWNIVPWYVGDGTRIRPVNTADLDESAPAIRKLIALLPDLRVVVLLGRKAARGWSRLAINDLPVLEAPHPGPRVVNTRPVARERDPRRPHPGSRSCPRLDRRPCTHAATRAHRGVGNAWGVRCSPDRGSRCAGCECDTALDIAREVAEGIASEDLDDLLILDESDARAHVVE